jgi:hypothetical protein
VLPFIFLASNIFLLCGGSYGELYERGYIIRYFSPLHREGGADLLGELRSSTAFAPKFAASWKTGSCCGPKARTVSSPHAAPEVLRTEGKDSLITTRRPRGPSHTTLMQRQPRRVQRTQLTGRRKVGPAAAGSSC